LLSFLKYVSLFPVFSALVHADPFRVLWWARVMG
jgi:hypothetical protein